MVCPYNHLHKDTPGNYQLGLRLQNLPGETCSAVNQPFLLISTQCCRKKSPSFLHPRLQAACVQGAKALPPYFSVSISQPRQHYGGKYGANMAGSGQVEKDAQPSFHRSFLCPGQDLVHSFSTSFENSAPCAKGKLHHTYTQHESLSILKQKKKEKGCFQHRKILKGSKSECQ